MEGLTGQIVTGAGLVGSWVFFLSGLVTAIVKGWIYVKSQHDSIVKEHETRDERNVVAIKVLKEALDGSKELNKELVEQNGRLLANSDLSVSMLESVDGRSRQGGA